eukprot:s1108_g10.t1
MVSIGLEQGVQGVPTHKGQCAGRFLYRLMALAKSPPPERRDELRPAVKLPNSVSYHEVTPVPSMDRSPRPPKSSSGSFGSEAKEMRTGDDWGGVVSLTVAGIDGLTSPLPSFRRKVAGSIFGLFKPKVSKIQITGRGSVFGRRWSLGSADEGDESQRQSAKSSDEYRNRFEKGFTMVEEEELGIAFCTRAKMRRKKGRESHLLLGLRWLFGKLSPESPQNTTWHVITSKQLSMVLKVSALISFSTVMALVALEPICVESSEGPLFARLGQGRDDGDLASCDDRSRVMMLLHFLNSLLYLLGSITYHLHLIIMDEASVGVFDITLQFSSSKRYAQSPYGPIATAGTDPENTRKTEPRPRPGAMATLEDDGKSQERASAVLRELCGYLVQQVHMGRTVHVPNLGLFFGGPGKMHFKVLEKLLPPGHHWDGPSPGIGPIAKARVEKIARGAGVHKELAEELLQSVVKDFWAAVQDSPEVELDLPGVGKIKVREKTLTFEAFGTEVLRAKVTAEHQMFSRTAGELWSRMPQSQHSLWSKAEEAEVLHKSSSTPVLKPLNHEARVNGEVSYPSSKRFTRQLPVSERLFPPILDRCSRTRAALFRESVNRDHISNVIGSNYSPHSRSLTIDHEAHASLSDTLIRRKPEPKTENQDRAQDVRNLDWTAEWPTILEESPVSGEIEAVQMSKKEFCRILCRYRHYTEAGVPAEVLAPYHRQWLEHAVLLLEFESLGGTGRPVACFSRKQIGP